MKVKNIFAAVSQKSVLDPLLGILDPKQVRFWGTAGTVKYLKSKGFGAQSVVSGFDFDGRVKSLDRVIFARILADRSNKKHLEELKKLASNAPGVKSRWHLENTPGVGNFAPFDLVIVDLYPPAKRDFPESMDIGGLALIRAAIKNYKNLALGFDEKSIVDLVNELRSQQGSTLLSFRKKQVITASKFIAERCRLETKYMSKL